MRKSRPEPTESGSGVHTHSLHHSASPRLKALCPHRLPICAASAGLPTIPAGPAVATAGSQWLLEKAPSYSAWHLFSGLLFLSHFPLLCLRAVCPHTTARSLSPLSPYTHSLPSYSSSHFPLPTTITFITQLKSCFLQEAFPECLLGILVSLTVLPSSRGIVSIGLLACSPYVHRVPEA